MIGSVTALLALQKGLPLSYNRDLQEDKAAVFDADDTLAAALVALPVMVASAEFEPPRPSSWVTALDLAEVLVGRGVAFRAAHDTVGRLVARLHTEGRELADLTAEELTATHPSFVTGDLSVVDPSGSVGRRISPGGGSFRSVADQITALRTRLDR